MIKVNAKPKGRLIRTWLLRLFLGGVCLAAALLLIAIGYQAYSSWRSGVGFPPPGEMVDVGGHRMHFQTSGQGGPTVVLEAAAGANGISWALVQPQIAKFARVISYDRAGLGWSEPSGKERTSESMVEELHALLDRADVPSPYVLVGHSLGGLNVRLFAQKYPELVAGMVLVDSTHEDQEARMPESVRKSFGIFSRIVRFGDTLSILGLPRLMVGAHPRMPPELAQADVAISTRTSHGKTAFRELANVNRSSEAVRAWKPRPDLPLVVLSAAEGEAPPGVPAEDAAKMETILKELQQELASRSSNSVFQVVTNTGHLIQLDRPDAVVTAIRQVVEAVRTGSSLRSIEGTIPAEATEQAVNARSQNELNDAPSERPGR